MTGLEDILGNISGPPNRTVIVARYNPRDRSVTAVQIAARRDGTRRRNPDRLLEAAGRLKAAAAAEPEDDHDEMTILTPDAKNRHRTEAAWFIAGAVAGAGAGEAAAQLTGMLDTGIRAALISSQCAIGIIAAAALQKRRERGAPAEDTADDLLDAIAGHQERQQKPTHAVQTEAKGRARMVTIPADYAGGTSG